MQALEWLEKRQPENSLTLALIPSLFWAGAILLGVFLIRQSGNEFSIGQVFAIMLGTLPMILSMRFDLPVQTYWLLSLPIPHQVFVRRAMRDKLIEIGPFALTFGLVIVVILALHFPINLFGAVILLLTCLLTWVAIANLSLIWFSLKRQKGWKLLVAYGAIGFAFLLVTFAAVGIIIAAKKDLKVLQIWNGQILINLLLFPFSVHFEAARALREGMTIATLGWLLGYAHFVALTFLWAFKCAPDFCEAMALEAKTTLHEQWTISETLPQRVRSRGFGKRERALAWLSWLMMKRHYLSAIIISVFVGFIGFVGLPIGLTLINVHRLLSLSGLVLLCFGLLLIIAMPSISSLPRLLGHLWLRALPINWRRAIFYLPLPYMVQILVMTSIYAFAAWLLAPNMFPVPTLVAMVVLFLGISFWASLDTFGCFALLLFAVLFVFVRHPLFWWLTAVLVWLLCIPAYRRMVAKFESGEIFMSATFSPHLLRSR